MIERANDHAEAASSITTVSRTVAVPAEAAGHAGLRCRLCCLGKEQQSRA